MLLSSPRRGRQREFERASIHWLDLSGRAPAAPGADAAPGPDDMLLHGWELMAFNIKTRGKLTYYYRGEAPVFSHIVTESQPDGDLKIYFAGFTGGDSATLDLGLGETVRMEPEQEIPLVFRAWESWLREAGICQSIAELDFIEMHAFGCMPKSPNPLVDPLGYAAEIGRLRKGYANAYSGFFREHLPEHGVPARFTVHLLDVPDAAASYEFYTTALLQTRTAVGE